MPRKRKNITELFAEFFKQQRDIACKSSETLRGYDAAFGLLIKIFPDLSLKEVTPELMQKFFAILKKRERRVGKDKIKKGITISTIATYRSKLNAFWDWLVAKQLLVKNPFDDIDYPKFSYDTRKFLSKRNLEKIFAALHSDPTLNILKKKRDIAVIDTLFNTGVRRGELLGLKLRDVDFKRRTLFISKDSSKSKRDRTVPINTRLLTSLKDYVECRNSCKKIAYTTPCLFVSANQDEGTTVHGLKHLFEELQERAGIKFHPHQFRHTFAVNLLNGGTDILKVKEMLGHIDIRMTAAYLRCLPTSMMRADIENLSLDTALECED